MLDLKDPQYPEKNLGTLELSVTLSPKEDVTDAVRNCMQNYSSIFLTQTVIFYLGATIPFNGKYASPQTCQNQKRN